ncbi:ERC protein 2-like isoform X1 [Sycon ciliatum]|uniref:ERC protein 2-like isoform X1 n=1 Tax=Sycon ciliatum TaxID=27933 RepID=UPI0031F708E2
MLNDLFEQIFHSEASFKERIAELKQVNSQRQARNSYQKDLDKQYAALFQSCLDGDNTLVAARLQNNLQLKTESILASQRKDQEKEVDALKDKKKSLEEDDESMRQQFVLEVNAFYTAHDLMGEGKNSRLAQTQHEHTSLADEVEQLQQEVAILEAEHQLSDQLAAENVTVEEEIKNLLSQREELNEHMQELQNSIRCHEDERKELEEQSLKNPEFQRLQQQLDAAQSERYESLCKELSNEVKTLQDTLAKTGKSNKDPNNATPVRKHQHIAKGSASISHVAGPTPSSKSGGNTHPKSVDSFSNIRLKTAYSTNTRPVHEAITFDSFWNDEEEFNGDDDFLDEIGVTEPAPQTMASRTGKEERAATSGSIPCRGKQQSASHRGQSSLEMYPPMAKKVRFH